MSIIKEFIAIMKQQIPDKFDSLNEYQGIYEQGYCKRGHKLLPLQNGKECFDCKLNSLTKLFFGTIFLKTFMSYFSIYIYR